MGKVLYKYIEARHLLSCLKNGGRVKLFDLPASDPIDCNFTISDDNLKKSFYMLAEVACLLELMNDDSYKKNRLVVKAFNTLKKDIDINGVYKQNILLKSLLNVTIKKGNYFRSFCKRYEPEFDKTYKDIIEKLKMRTLIGSLTYSNDEYRMWDYYGDHHKGLCIEYEFDNPNGLLDAIYTDDDNSFDLYTVLTHMIPSLYFGHKEMNGMSDECLNTCYLPFLKKRRGYSHEREVRRIFIDQRENIIKEEGLWFLTNVRVKAVYTGCMIDDNVRQQVEEICKNKVIVHHFILERGKNELTLVD